MGKYIHLRFIVFLFFLFTTGLQSFLFSQNKTNNFYFHLNVHTFYGHYSGNKNHASNLNFLPSYSVSFLPEIRLNRKSSFLLGIEWFSHGTSFSSYYFKKGLPAIYDKNFDFRYSLRWNELVVPILYRSFFEGKMRDRYKYFFDVGPAIRYVYPASCTVSDKTGAEIFDSKVVTQFNPSTKNNALGMFFQAAWGMEFFKDDLRRAFTFSILLKYPPSRFLFQEEFTAGSLFISQLHAGVGFGIRF